MNISKTKNNIDVVYASHEGYCDILDDIHNDNFTNIIDYQEISPSDICNFTRNALDKLPKKDCIILIHLTEAFSSVYWNMVFDIVKNYGVKKIIWVDGGLTPGYMYKHITDLKISHKTSHYFFTRLLNEKNSMYSKVLDYKDRKFYYVSLGRLTRRERVYFTNKITEDTDLKNKGIISCGWGNNEEYTIWNNSYHIKCAEDLTGNSVDKFPISLGDKDHEQYDVLHNFDLAIFNIVQESSVGFNSISHSTSYSKDPFWTSIDSDRHFFTEKSAKPFLMGQIPLFIATPGYVKQLKNLGFDLFEDIVSHDYDKEDYVITRCNRVYQELKRLSLQDIRNLNYKVKTYCLLRLQKNLDRLIELGSKENLTKWINNQIA
tara:strand:+ start:3630 stop:4754 length:1125 start_codon:yes stop_codon:yes gene_type:complete